VTEDLWYRNGLRFQCQVCGRCCTGDPGVIYVSAEEISAIAYHLGLPELEFEMNYLQRVEGRFTIRERLNGDCVMLGPFSRCCKIYPCRPKQCQAFPFWDLLLQSREAWEEEKIRCPGIGNGRLWSLEEIRKKEFRF
jgi:Fe-S-cluster containining protein